MEKAYQAKEANRRGVSHLRLVRDRELPGVLRHPRIVRLLPRQPCAAPPTPKLKSTCTSRCACFPQESPINYTGAVLYVSWSAGLGLRSGAPCRHTSLEKRGVERWIARCDFKRPACGGAAHPRARRFGWPSPSRPAPRTCDRTSCVDERKPERTRRNQQQKRGGTAFPTSTWRRTQGNQQQQQQRGNAASGSENKGALTCTAARPARPRTPASTAAPPPSARQTRGDLGHLWCVFCI